MVDTDRPSWNAAQPYYVYLIGMLHDRSQFCLLNDHVSWHRCLNQIFNTVSAFITDQDYQELQKELETLGRKIATKGNYSLGAMKTIQAELDAELMLLDGKIIRSAKHLWLPLVNTNEELDMEKMRREMNVTT